MTKSTKKKTKTTFRQKLWTGAKIVGTGMGVTAAAIYLDDSHYMRQVARNANPGPRPFG
jgi:hypothetical protein